MMQILLIIHLLIALALVGVVLLQRSEGGALGVGGGGGGFGGLMTARGSANLLTRTTAILAAIFMVTSMALAYFGGAATAPRSFMDRPAATVPAAPVAPPAPAQPTVPLAR
jgi:preprotein translocase subunit SecG